MQAVIIITCILVTVSTQHAKYFGYKVYRLRPSNVDQVDFLAQLSKNENLDFWSPITYAGNSIDVMVKPEIQTALESLLSYNAVEYETLIEDYENIAPKKRYQRMSSSPKSDSKISFAKFNRHNEINEYLDQLAKEYPNIVRVETIGQSYEGRALKLIKISKNITANNTVIFIDAGIHAREWAAPAQATYIINQLVENPKNSYLLDGIDYHILPLFNPDGYEYSHTNDRFWRKSRSPGKTCIGTDPNRNFDFHWAEIGVSREECSHTYTGPHPFSEAETRAVRDYILKYKSNAKLYLTLHSYGKYILYPWGYTSKLPENADELQHLAELVANAIYNVNYTNYTIGSATNILNAAAGGSDDWAKGVAGIEFVYTIELPGGGRYGFDLPPEQILPLVKETWEGCKVFFKYIIVKFRNKS